MWANAERDGRPAEHTWWPVFNAAVWLTPTTWLPFSNADKTRKPLKLAGVPQTTGPISAACGPKFTILWGHLEEIFSIVDTCLSFEDIWHDKVVPWCPDGDIWRLLCPAFPGSCVQHASGLLKFALRPHHVWNIADIQSATAQIRRGKKERRNHRAKILHGDHNQRQ